LETQYGVDGAGLPGNDDYGTMSAWLIFASLGFYPLPSTETYVLGSPTIHSARILRRTIDGKLLALNIGVQNNKVKSYKVNSVTINGKAIKNFITHSELSPQNSILSFSME
jgi:putative alpha-1,2-mannosidase